jgi:hypothetical protein
VRFGASLCTNQKLATHVTWIPLRRPALLTCAGVPNFKRFRRAGAAAQPPAAAPVIAFDPEPYQEGRIDAEAFLR